MGVTGCAVLVHAHKYRVVVLLILVDQPQLDEGGEYVPVQVAVLEEIGEHPPVVLIGGRQLEGLLHFFFGLVHPGAELADVLVQQGQHRLLIIHAVELLEKCHRPAALLGGMVVPLIALDGDAVVAGHAELQPGADEGLPLEAEELHQVYRVGLELLFFCEMDVGHFKPPLNAKRPGYRVDGTLASVTDVLFGCDLLFWHWLEGGVGFGFLSHDVPKHFLVSVCRTIDLTGKFKAVIFRRLVFRQ